MTPISDAEKLRAWVSEAGTKVDAMLHWYSVNPHIPPEVWNDGPYPEMKKLIAICRKLLVAAEMYSVLKWKKSANSLECVDDLGEIASKALSDCVDLVGE